MVEQAGCLVALTMRLRQVIHLKTNHDDMETLSAFLALCEGNHRSPVDSPRHGPVTSSFNVVFVFSLNKLLNKHGRYYEMPLRPSDIAVICPWNVDTILLRFVLLCSYHIYLRIHMIDFYTVSEAIANLPRHQWRYPERCKKRVK